MIYYDFTDEQIAMANAALQCVMENDGIQEGYIVWREMGKEGRRPERMRESMVKDLHLFEFVSGNVRITLEGRMAYKMGFEKYLRRKEFARRYGENKDILAMGIAIGGIVVGAIIGVLGIIQK